MSVSCLKPTEAWQDMRQFTKNGKHPVIFSYKEVLELAHGDVTALEGNSRFRPLTVRCGKCLLCRQVRAEEIAVRALLELKSYPVDVQHSFITLTVSDDRLPEVFPDARLNHRSFQLFMKRLRKRGVDCRYLMCGEYGERTHRPHYHCVLFGWMPLDGYFDSLGCWHGSKLLEEVWPFGHVTCEPVNPNRIFYVAGYTLKFGSDEERWRPYVRWSRRPGLGHDYIVSRGWQQMVIEDVEWFRHQKFKTFFYRTFVGRKEVRFASRFVDEKLRLTNPEKFDTLFSARQGRLLLEQEKLKSSPEAQALSRKALMNKANQIRYQLARRKRELQPVVA